MIFSTNWAPTYIYVCIFVCAHDTSSTSATEFIEYASFILSYKFCLFKPCQKIKLKKPFAKTFD